MSQTGKKKRARSSQTNTTSEVIKEESPQVLVVTNPNLEMMTTISNNEQSLDDIKNLTSSKVTDQLKVFLVSQARNELSRIVKLTKFLDKLESKFIDKVDKAMEEDALTLKQYNDVISIITDLLARSNDIVYKVLKDDSLMTILNTTIYTSDNTTQVTSAIATLKDPQSRERVRNVIQNILATTVAYEGEGEIQQ